MVWRDRIYFDDCERTNGWDYFPYHTVDPQWTWYPKSPDGWYSYSPHYTSDGIKIESDIYRIIEGWWGYEMGWILDGVDFDIVGHLQGLEPGGTATFTFSDTVPGDRDWKGKPGLSWNLCSIGDGMSGNNNFYIISSDGTKIGIHSRNESIYIWPVVHSYYYSYITVNDVVQDSWYKYIIGAEEYAPSESWSYMTKVGNTYTYYIKPTEEDVYGTISATASLSEIKTIQYVAPTVDYYKDCICVGHWFKYTSSYGTSYIYKNVYDAGIDQRDLIYCDEITYRIRVTIQVGDSLPTTLKFCFGVNTWDEWEQDIVINESGTWQYGYFDISNFPLPIKKNGFKYVGFKYIHDQPEVEYDYFNFYIDGIYADPTEAGIGDAIIF